MLNFKQNEDAVSPVIGVILMVAITVILAAVIAMFVFNMAGDVQSTKTVGVTAKLQADDVVVTYVGGSDDASLQYLKIIVDGDTYYSSKTTSDSNVVGSTDATNAGKPSVGTKMTIGVSNTPTQHTVTVVGKFADGTEQPLLDTTL